MCKSCFEQFKQMFPGGAPQGSRRCFLHVEDFAMIAGPPLSFSCSERDDDFLSLSLLVRFKTVSTRCITDSGNTGAADKPEETHRKEPRCPACMANRTKCPASRAHELRRVDIPRRDKTQLCQAPCPPVGPSTRTHKSRLAPHHSASQHSLLP